MSHYSRFCTWPLSSSTFAALIVLYHSHLNGDTSSDVKVQVREVHILIFSGYHTFTQGSIVPNDLCGFKIKAQHHLLWNHVWRRWLTCILEWKGTLSPSIKYRIDILIEAVVL